MTDKSGYPKAGIPSAGDLAEPVARAVRDEVRRELREQSGRRAVRLYGGAAAAALYAGGALTACLVLLFALALPAWAAALIVFALLLVAAGWLKNSAAQASGPGPGVASGPTAPSGPSGPAPPTGPSGPAAPGSAGPSGPSGPSAPPTPPTPPAPGSGAPPQPPQPPQTG
ncbi:phage holin family protein [Streptomyces sp. NEAU-YJ-81]|uniref:phage holin family protein n=1 Tax=Streptomyces sp. NEAU-YJ-81 TaxID=2820288 RepID=UPI001ABCF31F|nr:phage holin family protein [Streptomyces sp. NEAU-YJ-81]MBO3677617.1 phage holin family protein [Streptomyces sp. NEAU-YJ-81]